MAISASGGQSLSILGDVAAVNLKVLLFACRQPRAAMVSNSEVFSSAEGIQERKLTSMAKPRRLDDVHVVLGVPVTKDGRMYL